jgi:hypothetical protein
MDLQCSYGSYALVFLTEHGYAPPWGYFFYKTNDAFFQVSFAQSSTTFIGKEFRPSNTSSDLTL